MHILIYLCIVLLSACSYVCAVLLYQITQVLLLRVSQCCAEAAERIGAPLRQKEKQPPVSLSGGFIALECDSTNKWIETKYEVNHHKTHSRHSRTRMLSAISSLRISSACKAWTSCASTTICLQRTADSLRRARVSRSDIPHCSMSAGGWARTQLWKRKVTVINPGTSHYTHWEPHVVTV